MGEQGSGDRGGCARGWPPIAGTLMPLHLQTTLPCLKPSCRLPGDAVREEPQRGGCLAEQLRRIHAAGKAGGCRGGTSAGAGARLLAGASLAARRGGTGPGSQPWFAAAGVDSCASH